MSEGILLISLFNRFNRQNGQFVLHRATLDLAIIGFLWVLWKDGAEYLDDSRGNEPISLLCLLMSVYCEVGRSHADSLHHMVHPGKRLEINVFVNLLSYHLVPAPRRVMVWES